MENSDIRNNQGIIKEEVSIVIRKTQKIIEEFDNRLKHEKDKLTIIDDVKRELNRIVSQLNNIKEAVKDITILYEELEEFLDQQQDELKNCNTVIIQENKNQLIELINENLPDDMSLRKLLDIENSWKIVLESNSIRQSNTNSKKQKKISLYNEEQRSIGEMLLEELKEELLIKIKIHDEINFQDFRIDNPLKVFPIVNHIITRYNYKEETMKII